MNLEKKLTITLEEASQFTGIPIGTLREYISKDKIKATKPGKLVLIYTDSLIKFLKRAEIAS